jgi:hypothetical protein
VLALDRPQSIRQRAPPLALASLLAVMTIADRFGLAALFGPRSWLQENVMRYSALQHQCVETRFVPLRRNLVAMHCLAKFAIVRCRAALPRVASS